MGIAPGRPNRKLIPHSLNHTACLLCNSTNLVPAGSSYAHAFLVKCRSCGLVFCEKIPTAGELGEHYANYPRDNSISPVTIRRYQELLEKFEGYRKLNRMLDIGCGDGYFLETAKEKGWHVSGTEFTPEAVAICRKKGIGMHQGAIQHFNPEEKFDVITSFEVLEHIRDGNEHMQKIAHLLRPGGLFYFTTPNFNSLSRRMLGGKWNVIEYPEHLVYYTPATIDKQLRKNGFKKLSLQTTGFSFNRFRKSTGGDAVKNTDEKLRSAMEEKGHLRAAKRILNGVLNLTSLGDTLKGFYLKA
jgi:2-polyprenyl-3-methyl-5-hydroxy-6-metoxy-1,4-benzoquinol methylase